MVVLYSPLAPLHLAPVAAAVDAGEKLSPPTRAAVLMALLGIALIGLLLIVVILLGGHWVRRQGAHRRGPSVPPDRGPLAARAVGLSSEKKSSIEEADNLANDSPNHGKTAGL